MNQISAYLLAILVGTVLFGVVLGLLHFFHMRKLRSAAGVIETLERRAAKELVRTEKELREEEVLTARSALYGIPYLAWAVTSLVIPAVFLILFFQNLVAPYNVPAVGSDAWFAYRAPTDFSFEGHDYVQSELLVRRGSRITEKDQDLIRGALSHRGHVRPTRAIGTAILLTVFCFVLLYHINILYPTSTEKNRNLILIYLIIVILLACAKVSLFYDLYSAYLIPIPWAGMVITIFINRRVVPLIMLVTLIFVSVASNFNFGLFLVLLAGGLLSGSRVRQARRRSQVILASFAVGIVMVLILLAHSMILPGPELPSSSDLIASFMNGIVSGLLVLISLPFLELIFDLASPFRLMELLDLNTPLLKEFFFKAPGTYQHTMVVANLAETVANEIGANGLLVRVGTYYHDIGKMFNPQFFIENQSPGHNPHDNLGPVASAAVVRSHVILGVRLARQVGLPRTVVDFIPEHHGTSTIDYFYYKSKRLESEMKSERIFKYPGPKPQSKETAILMIVDSVEAAFRVAQDHSEEAIRELIRKIANSKLERGELDRSGLTIGEFKKIIDILTHILKSSSHQRIAYPTEEELKAQQSSATNGKAQS